MKITALFALLSAFALTPAFAQEANCKQYEPAPGTYNPLEGMVSRLNVLDKKIADRRVDVYANIKYRNTGDIRNKMDAYLPADRQPGKPTPVIIMVHGGAWATGNKACMFIPTTLYETVRKKMLNNGIGVFSINYRYANKNPEEQIADVQAAVEMVRSLSVVGRYSCNKIGISGDSAGSHLAQLQILRQPEAITKFYVGTAGPTRLYDLALTAGKIRIDVLKNAQCDKVVALNPFGKFSFLDLLKDFTNGESHFHDACINPFDLVNTGAACWNKNTKPEMFYVHGTLDPLVQPQQSIDMVKLLKEKGYSATLMTLPFQHGGSNAQQNQNMGNEFVAFAKKVFAKY